MSDALRGIIVSHGNVAKALVEAVHAITGSSDVLVAISNEGMDRDALCQAIGCAVETVPTVVFVDMPGGSCLQAAMLQCRERDGVAIVSGVNLPMLIDFVYHRDVSPAEAAARAVSAGTRAIGDVGA